MALSEFALSEEPLSGDEVGTFDGALDYWVVLGGEIQTLVQIDKVTIEDSLGGSSTARFHLLNPIAVPVAGQTVQIVWQDETLFGGQVTTVTLHADQAESVLDFSCEAVGWMRILERRTIAASYTSQTFRQIAESVIASTLFGEGLTIGTVDDGPVLDFVDADHIRASEFLRDVASGSGGSMFIDPYKRIQFLTSSVMTAPFLMTESDVLDIESVQDLDQYRNRETVLATGPGGASVNVTRSITDEISARQALEGGTGIYEGYDRIEHPTSDDLVTLSRFGVSYALTKLAALSRVSRSFRARTRRPYLRLGQLLSVSLSAYRLTGDWQIVRLRTWDEGQALRFEIEAQLAGYQTLALNSLLKIVEAGHATVILPVADFASLDTVTTAGASTYTVVGSGTVELEISVYGPSGGGQAGYSDRAGQTAFSKNGWNGGNGGKAVFFTSLSAGTVFDIYLGPPGLGGVYAGLGVFTGPLGPGDGGQPGTDATYSTIALSGLVLARAEGGKGGYFGGGAPGQATGDFRFPGDGSTGGVGGLYTTGGASPTLNSGASGNYGKVEIRY